MPETVSSAQPDVVIVGAGVIGLSCAWFLQQRGRRVLLVDRGQVGQGASHGNCGMVSPSHAAPLAIPGLLPKALRWMWQPDAPLYIRPTLDPRRLAWLLRFARRCNWPDFWASARAKAVLLNRSRALFDQIIGGERLQCEFDPVGHLCVYRDPAAFAEADQSIEIMQQLGIRVQRLESEELHALEPALHPAVVGGLFNPDDAHLRPDRYVAELARVVRERGAEFRLDEEVRGFELAEGAVRAVLTCHGRLPASAVVLAAGAWSPALGRQLGLKLRIEPAKGYSITMSRPALVPRRSIVFRERGVAVTPWPSGYRLGSTYEFSGFDPSHNPVRFQALRRAATEYLRDPFGEFLEEEWIGFRPMTPDGLPYLQRAPRLRNAFVAAGHGTLGMSMSPASGEKIAQLLTE